MIRMSFVFVICLAIFASGEVQVRLSASQLVAVPSLRIAANVTDLRLDYNQIETLPDFVFENFTELQNLDLDSNRIRHISDAAFASTSIVHLYLNNNELTEFPNLCSINGSLRYLELPNNRIEHLAEENVTCLTSLETLDLSDNNITVFPSFGEASASLDSFIVRSNRIELIEPEKFAPLTALRLLNIENNLLRAYPNFSLLPEPGLITLVLAMNPLIRIPADLFASLPSIGDLSLRNLEGEDPYELPNISPSSPTIKKIDLGGNLYVDITKTDLENLASAMPSLEILDLRGIIAPNLPYLDQAFANRTLYVDVSSNKFYCNCSLAWMVDPNNGFKVDLTQTTCSEDSPPSLRDKTINMLTVDEICSDAASTSLPTEKTTVMTSTEQIIETSTTNIITSEYVDVNVTTSSNLAGSSTEHVITEVTERVTLPWTSRQLESNNFTKMVITALQSSTWNGYRANLAVDADVDTCAITGYDRNHWIMVELEKNVEIPGINILLLWDLPGVRMSVRLSNHSNPYEDQFPLMSELCASISTDIRRGYASVRCWFTNKSQYVILTAKSTTGDQPFRFGVCEVNVLLEEDKATENVAL